MMTKDEMPACPVATTVQLIGSKWKLLILRDLLSRPWRFNELRRDLEGVSQKVLTDSLRALEADGIVRRTVYPEVPPRVEYSLTESRRDEGLGRAVQSPEPARANRSMTKADPDAGRPFGLAGFTKRVRFPCGRRLPGTAWRGCHPPAARRRAVRRPKDRPPGGWRRWG